MRDGTSTFWATLQLKWKKKKDPDVCFHEIAPKENRAILDQDFDIKPVYNSLENHVKEPLEKPSEMNNEREPMSCKRKVCFVLSFNLWIIYFAAFLWIIPCVERKCPGAKKWDTNISSVDLTTNIDTIDNVVIFGYQDISLEDFQIRGMALALNSTNGDIIWTKEFDSIPLDIHCRKNFSDVYSACLINSASKLKMINSHTGETILNQTLSYDSRNEMTTNYLICGLSPTEIMISKKWKITQDINQHQLPVLNLNKEAFTLQKFPTPKFCTSGSFNIYPTILNYNDGNYVVFSCYSLQKIEFWAVSAKTICDGSNAIAEVPFTYLFSLNRSSENSVRQEFTLSDSGDDCIIISWSNLMVCMSKKSLTEIWRYQIREADAVIKYIFYGHFTSMAVEELAVISRENNQYSVFILGLSDGSMTMNTQFYPNNELESAYHISGAKHSKLDFLLLNAKSSNSSKLPSLIHESLDTFNIPLIYESMMENTFYTVDFQTSPEISKIVTVLSLTGEIIIDNDIDVTLLVMEKRNKLFITAYLLRSWEYMFCHD